MNSEIKKVGIVAGEGALPILIAQEVKAKGIEVVSIALSDAISDSLTPYSDVCQISVGQIGKLIKLLKVKGVTHVVMAGKVNKGVLYKKPKLDLKAIAILAKLKDRCDDTILLAIVDEIEKAGMRVVKQSLFLRHLMPDKGLIAGKKPSRVQEGDIEFGFRYAKEIARLDIGQTVVVKNRAVMAVEAIEGTDEAIKRGAALCGEGAVVVKVEKPSQDPRFDLPTIGPSTVRSLVEGKGSLIAIEAGKTLLVEPEEVISIAQKGGITIIAV
ncbi:MAG: UDP-2,3-diacylglucosamine diphosphatase LpxI [Nitrospinota bacterium]